MHVESMQSPPVLADSAGFIGGVWYGTSSFYAINVTQSELALHCFGKRARIPKDSVRRISRWRGLFSTGVRIEHSAGGIEPFVVFWTPNFQQVAGALETAGYVVTK